MARSTADDQSHGEQTTFETNEDSQRNQTKVIRSTLRATQIYLKPLKIMSQETPSKQQLEEIFSDYDKDGSGKIDSGELKNAVKEYFKAIGTVPTEKDIEEAVAGILQLSDSTGDGKIDRKEWFQYFGV